MKKLVLCLMLCSTTVGAQQLTYHSLPDASHRLVTLGSRVVIQDARGFFVGYYKPLPPSAAPFVPERRVPAGQYTGRSGAYYSMFEPCPAALIPHPPYDDSYANSICMPDYDSYGDCSTAGWSSGGPSSCDSPCNSGGCPSGR